MTGSEAGINLADLHWLEDRSRGIKRPVSFRSGTAAGETPRAVHWRQKSQT